MKCSEQFKIMLKNWKGINYMMVEKGNVLPHDISVL